MSVPMVVRALIIEDEKPLADLLGKYLEREGFEVHQALDGAAALDDARKIAPDIVVLDWMLPKVDGLEVLRKLRRFSDAYVIILTARSEAVDKIVGLSAGADDYLTKPFNPGELVVRIRAMLRRPRGTASEEEGVPPIQSGELVVDPARRRVWLKEREISLTALEFDLLQALSVRSGFVMSRAQLLAQVWGADYFGDEHVVDVHIAHLRKKLGDDPANPRYIETVRGVGYRFKG